MDYNEIYRNMLRLQLHRKGITQKQLGERVGVAQHSISDYVCGKSVPPIGTAVSIAKELGFPLDALFGLPPFSEPFALEPKEQQLLDLYYQFSAEKRDTAITLLEAAVSLTKKK